MVGRLGSHHRFARGGHNRRALLTDIRQVELVFKSTVHPVDKEPLGLARAELGRWVLSTY